VSKNPSPPSTTDYAHTTDINAQNLLILRQGLLAQVDAIERILGMPTTADIRRWAKERGFYDDPCEGLAQKK
jgi:hypothetical protein